MHHIILFHKILQLEYPTFTKNLIQLRKFIFAGLWQIERHILILPSCVLQLQLQEKWPQLAHYLITLQRLVKKIRNSICLVHGVTSKSKIEPSGNGENHSLTPCNTAPPSMPQRRTTCNITPPGLQFRTICKIQIGRQGLERGLTFAK